MREAFTFELEEPLEFPGQETLTKLTIMPYTGNDIVECGMPFSIIRGKDGEASETVMPLPCKLLIARMAKVPPPMIGRLSAADFATAIEALKSFFFYRTRKTSSNDTLSPQSGQETSITSSV
jgi:hypothetical protein